MYVTYEQKQLLVGLRGKDRAKMLYAFQQAEVEAAHTIALFELWAATKHQPLTECITTNRDAINEAAQALSSRFDTFYAELKLLIAPYEFGRSYTHEAPRMNLYAFSVLESIATHLRYSTQTALWVSLRAYRTTLAQPKVEVKNVLTSEEKTEVVVAITVVKSLAAVNPTPDANGVVEAVVVS